MIPVKRRLAPAKFNEKVLRPGRRWLKQHRLPSSGPVPEGVQLEPFWHACLDDLHRKYQGVCAYVCVYIDKVTGARSVDHFVAKSGAIEHAYRWSNYRLACQKMNARKGVFDDVLDPFDIQQGTFVLNLFDGSIAPRPGLEAALHQKAENTISRLGLDEEDCRTVRREYFRAYREGHISLDYLRRRCPFVWEEIRRQNAVRPSAA